MTSILTAKGGFGAEGVEGKAELFLEYGWSRDEGYDLTIQVTTGDGGETYTSINLSKKELKTLRREIKRILDEEEGTFF